MPSRTSIDTYLALQREIAALTGEVNAKHGDVDWAPLFAALWRAGYDGDVIIEHEDRDFEGTDEKVKRGFLLARNVLRPYVV